jgi:hypothetical protein
MPILKYYTKNEIIFLPNLELQFIESTTNQMGRQESAMRPTHYACIIVILEWNSEF